MPYHSETYACYVDESGAIMRAPFCLHTKQRDYSRAKPFTPPVLTIIESNKNTLRLWHRLRRDQRKTQLNEFRARYIDQYNREPTTKELAQMAGVSKETVIKVLGARKSWKLIFTDK